MSPESDLRATLKAYCARGFKLFPLGRQSKRPCIDDNLNRASDDLNVLMAWAKAFPDCNWGLSLARSGLVAVDVDEKHGGLDAWTDLILTHGEPETLKAQSGSGVGLHYVFKADPEKKYRGKIVKGIDVKFNGYIAVHPSVHPGTGNRYQWLNEESPIAPPSAWLKPLIERPPLPQVDRSKREWSIEAKRFQAIIDELKEREIPYEDWTRLGMAIHSAFNGSDEGLDLYIDMSSGISMKSEADLETARSKYQGFRLEGGVNAGTFFTIARALGATIPAADFEEDKKLFAENPIEMPGAWSKVGGTWVTYDDDFAVDDLNAKGFAMMTGAQEGAIIRVWENERGIKHVHGVAKERFKDTVAEYKVRKTKATGGWSVRDASAVWLESAKKTRFSGIVFKPQAEPSELNLWCDIPCEPREGNVSLILELIHVLCGEDERRAKYFTEWLAHLVQKPAEKCVIVPVFIGEEGAGKGLFFDGIMMPLLSRDFYNRLDNPRVIKERFNTEQSRKLMTVLDEASWRGDHELVNIMKSLTGSETMTVEEKFGARYTIENFSRYVVLSNEAEAVRVGLENRRYLIFNTSNAWKGTDKFHRLSRALKEDRLYECFYGYLRGLDIADFNSFQFPAFMDTGGADTKVLSMSSVGQFWGDILLIAPTPIFTSEGLPFQAAYNEFCSYMDRVRPQGKRFSLRAFIKETEALMPGLRVKGRAWDSTPFEMMTAYCKRNRLAPPAGFDDLDYLASEDFQD